jgi:hypothetical protein
LLHVGHALADHHCLDGCRRHIVNGGAGRVADDPAKNRARVQLIVVSTARTTDITVSGATLSTYTSTALSGPVTDAGQTGETMRTSNGSPGHASEVRFDIILADVVSDGIVTWNLATDALGDASIEVFSANEPEPSANHGTAYLDAIRNGQRRSKQGLEPAS